MDCLLTKKERTALCEYLDRLEWDTYQPIKKRSSAYASAKVEEYDEVMIIIELTWGVDSDGWSETVSIDIMREDLLTPENLYV